MILQIIIIYIIFLFLQILSIEYKPPLNYIDKKIIFNNNNKDVLNSLLKNKLNEYSLLLQEMEYDDWIKYVQNNNFIYYKGKSYYFFLYEYVNDDKNILLGYPAGLFISKALYDNEHINLTWQSINNLTKDSEKFTKFLTNDSWAATAYLYSDEKKIKDMDYYWINPNTKRITKKTSFLKRFKKGEKENGFIGIGYDLENLDEKKIKNFKYLNKYSFAFGSFISLIVAFFILIFNKNHYFMALISLFLINIYILAYVNTEGTENSADTEKERTDNVNNGVLSISFLTAVNIFIITSSKNSDLNLFTENSIIFGISLILLLIAIYKKLNYNTTKDLLIQRINKEFFFNYVIVLNIYLVINYIASVLF